MPAYMYVNAALELAMELGQVYAWRGGLYVGHGFVPPLLNLARSRSRASRFRELADQVTHFSTSSD